MSGKFPKKLSLGLAFMLTDIYQTPVILCEGLYSEVKGFFKEATRARQDLPFNTVNLQTDTVNRLGRPKKFVPSGFRFEREMKAA